MVLAGLMVPFSGAFAARPSGRVLLATWSDTADVVTYEEGNRAIAYRGSWFSTYYDAYMGGKARSTDTSGSKASLRFKGTAVSWIGPIGPTRGSARVYIDGSLIKTVSTYNGSFVPTRVLFKRTWASSSSHRIDIVSSGTDGHPTVALDAFLVRKTVDTADAPGVDPVDPAPPTDTPTDAPTAAPTDPPATATPDPTPPPATPVPATPAPTVTPAPTAAPTATPPPTVAPTPTPTVAPTPTPKPTVAPTPPPTPAPTRTPSPTPAPTATPAPTSAPAASVRVTTIPALLTALADNTVTDIVVANGTYRVSAAGQQRSDSLWIDSRFASRTKAVTVRAETRGGVTFDGGGTSYFGGLTFVAGAHDQTWDGFKFANGKPTETGVIVFGGYGLASPHHITLRNITMLPTIVASTAQNDHLVYFSSDGPHDILIEDYTATPGSGIRSALQFYHSKNVYNLTVRRMHVVGSGNAILMYDATVHDVLIEDSDIKDASITALNLAYAGSNVVLRNNVSTNSGGTYFPNGIPSGVSLIGNSFH